jgi:hypothetical protein
MKLFVQTDVVHVDVVVWIVLQVIDQIPRLASGVDLQARIKIHLNK